MNVEKPLAGLLSWNTIAPGPRLWLALFAAALVFRLGLFAWRHNEFLENAAQGEMANIARCIVQHNVFGNPYVDKASTGPTAHCPPLFPFYLSLLIRISPDTAFFHRIEVILALIAASCLWASLPLVSFRLQIGTLPGLLAWAFGAFNPLYRWIEGEGVWDANYSALCMAILLPFTTRQLGQPASLMLILEIGIAWGLFTLMNPVAATSFIAALLAAFFCRRSAWLLLLRQTAAISLIIFVLLIPWIIRTRLVLGGWVPTLRSNLGLELSLSYSDEAKPHMADKLYGGGIVRHPNYLLAEALRIKEVGELPYMAERLSEAKAWIASNTWQALRLTAGHAAYFWVPRRKNALLRTGEFFLTLAALAGLWSLRHKREAFVLFLVLWLIYPIPYYLVYNEERYRWPMNWSIILMAGVFLAHALRRLQLRLHHSC